PGFPTPVFGTLAALVFALGLYVHRRSLIKKPSESTALQDLRQNKKAIAASLASPLTLRIGIGQRGQGGQDIDFSRLAQALERFCNKKFDELGLQIPVPTIVPTPELPPNTIEIQLYVVPVVHLAVPPDMGLVWLAANKLQKAIQSEPQENTLQWG